MRSVIPMRAAKIGYIFVSIALCLFGGMLLVRTDLSVSFIGRAAGIGMLIFGCIKVLGYFSRDLFRLAFQYDLAFGLLLIALGCLALLRPERVLTTICVLMGCTVLADGLFKIQISIDAKRFGIRKWWLILAVAITTGITGLALTIRPAESTRFLTALLGLALLADGLLSLVTVLSTVKIIHHQYPDTVDREPPQDKKRRTGI